MADGWHLIVKWHQMALKCHSDYYYGRMAKPKWETSCILEVFLWSWRDYWASQTSLRYKTKLWWQSWPSQDTSPDSAVYYNHSVTCDSWTERAKTQTMKDKPVIDVICKLHCESKTCTLCSFMTWQIITAYELATRTHPTWREHSGWWW